MYVPKILLGIALVIGVSSFVVYKVSPNFLSHNMRNGSYDAFSQTAYFHGESYKVPSEIKTKNLTTSDSNNILGSSTSSNKKEKRIEVDLSKQKLYAYEGNKLKYKFTISSGKWGLTPTGNFQIFNKLKYTSMIGGSVEAGTYYNLPNVPFTMYFYKDFGIHGAYWHDNFGHPMSHGCVNMKIDDAQKLFYWSKPEVPDDKNAIQSSKDNPGTKVIIYGTTPEV